MLIGYARVSTQDQNIDWQIDLLKKAGCERVYDEKVSGSKSNRPKLEECLRHLRSGDTLVVWKIDRLGRSLKDLLDIMASLQERKITFKSLTESLDTETPMGRLMFHIFGIVAEYERNLHIERTHAGLASARAKGRKGGRPRKHNDKLLASVEYLASNSDSSITEVCKEMGISRATYYRRKSASNIIS